MGRKRITQLLDQLQSNYDADLQNAAAIFTVAQVAINQLEQQVAEPVAIASLAPAIQLSEEDLKKRYGDYQACRRAAKQQGIYFRRTPSMKQLAAAFAYYEACEKLIQEYLKHQPDSALHGVSMQFKMD